MFATAKLTGEHMRAVNKNLQRLGGNRRAIPAGKRARVIPPSTCRPAIPPTVRRPPLPASMRLEFEGGEGMPLRAAVHGEIDYSGAFSMQVRIAAACRRRRARGLIVDLSGTEFMSSSGLAALLNLQREAACLRGGMLLVLPTPEVRYLLAITGVDRRLLVVDSCEEAEILLLYSAAGADTSPSLPRDPSFN
jgi:stage II sporulation protein AA (anti-sigma F factor antagonist)